MSKVLTPSSSPALVTVPSMGYAPAPTLTSLQPLPSQQPVFVVQEVRAGMSLWGWRSWASLPGVASKARLEWGEEWGLGRTPQTQLQDPSHQD